MLLLALVMYYYSVANMTKVNAPKNCYDVASDWSLFMVFYKQPSCTKLFYCFRRTPYIINSGQGYWCPKIRITNDFYPNNTYIDILITCNGTQLIECVDGYRTPLPTSTPLPTATARLLETQSKLKPTKTPRPIKSLVCITPQPYKANPVPAAVGLYQFLFE